tara:strand:- start:43411 stop:44463 length:1053 start_codon:yes stop_codon:yes gene_type:complete
LKTLWYYFFKTIIRISLFFYFKKIKVVGRENIPTKGALLFMVNHPNALMDPLIVAANNPRVQHFLVRAAAFKKPLIKKFLGTLNLMPIYRIRDGIKKLEKNQEIFEKCFSILNNEKSLMIFPEGSHDKRRSIRPLSKGFSRIVFGALEANPDLQIHIILVGLTYQNPSVYPTNVCVQYGKPILANDYYKIESINSEIKQLKDAISSQLKSLSVHIPLDQNYQNTLDKLNKGNVNFIEVKEVNSMIESKIISTRDRKPNLLKLLKPVIILNSIIPWLLWKYVESKNSEFEFIDTFRYGVSTLAFCFFYLLQTYIIIYFYNWKIGIIYLSLSIILILLYGKFHPTPAELTPE